MLALYWLQLALAGGIILFRPYYLAQVVEGKVVLHNFDRFKKVRAVLAVTIAAHYTQGRVQESRLSYLLFSLCNCVIALYVVRFSTDACALIVGIAFFCGLAFVEKEKPVKIPQSTFLDWTPCFSQL